MFDVDRVHVFVRKVTVKLETVKEHGEERTARVCECTFRIPVLDYDTAAHVRLPLTAHCFDRDRMPLWTVHDVAFTPPEDTYTATLHEAPDSPAAHVLHYCTIKRVRVFRGVKDRRDLTLDFVTRHELARGDAKDLAELLHVWESGLTAITLATVQLPLELTPPDPPAAEGRPTRH